MLNAKRESQVTFLHSEALDRVPGIVHGFSTRRAERNDFTVGPLSSSNPIIPVNRARFVAAVGAPGWPILKLKQVHSGVVVDMEDTKAAGDPIEGDASVTVLHGALLGVQTADCVPILIADAGGSCVAAVHAGWRGTAARIAAMTVVRMVQKFGVRAANLYAAIGPHIGVCCYEVGPEVEEAIPNKDAFERRPEWEKPHLNLAAANRAQLIQAGMPDDHIDATTLCTQCRPDLFFSYRGEAERSGRMLSVIGIAP